MKHTTKYLTLLVACLLATNMSATYYIAGNGTDDPNRKWCNNSDWGFQPLSGDNSITFYGVAAGKDYGFKIKDTNDWGTGSEYTTFDYDNSDQPLYGGNGGDMGFTLTETADVTISVVEGKVRVQATKPLAYREDYYRISGNGSERGTPWCSGKDWGDNSENKLINDEISYSSLPAGDYVFKIEHGNWSKQWGFSEVDAANSTRGYSGSEGNDVKFTLYAPTDVTIKMVKGKIQLLIDYEYIVTGNGGSLGSWCAGHYWKDIDNESKLDANHSITYESLPEGEYEFKIKVNCNNWNVEYGYSDLDTENSSPCVAAGSNIKFSLIGNTKVKIALIEGKVRLTVYAYYIAGNGEDRGAPWCGGENWNARNSDSRFDMTSPIMTYASLAPGEYKFKITNGTWSGELNFNNLDVDESSLGFYPSGNDDDNPEIAFTLDEVSSVSVALDIATQKIKVTTPKGYFAWCTPFSIAGDEALTGFDWSNTEVSTEMTDNGDGTFTYIAVDKNLAAGTYHYKVIANHSWNVGRTYPYGVGNNAWVDIPVNGVYTLKYTFVPSTKMLTCTPMLQHNLTISAYGYSTFYSDKAFVLPDGLTATIYTNISGTMLTGEAITTIPANTGVVLCGAANATYTLLQTTTDESYPANLLRGTISDQVINNSNVHYILGVKGGQCGLFWPNGTDEGVGSFTNKAGKAYLEVEPAAMPAPVRGFIIAAPTVATSLDALSVKEDNCYYDLFGRKVAEPQAGNVYIQNGKKVVLF